MLLPLVLLLPALSPSSQEICSAPGSLPAPTLHLSQTSARPGDSVRLQCSVISQAPATRVVFCEDGEEVSSQRGLLGKLTYDSHHVVSGGSSGDYSCGYEIKDSDNRVIGSQLSPVQSLSVTGALPAPILHLNQTSAQPGDSVQLQCSMSSWVRATRIIFYKDGEEVSSQRSFQGNLAYDYDHMVSGSSSGSYACGYEIQDGKNRVIRSQLSPAQHLSITGLDLKLLLGITIPAILVLAVALYLLGRKGNVAPSLITLSRCFQLCLCGGITGIASSVTPAAPHKSIFSVPRRTCQKAPSPRERRRCMRTSLCSKTDIISTPVSETRGKSVRSRISEPPQIRGNYTGLCHKEGSGPCLRSQLDNAQHPVRCRKQCSFSIKLGEMP